MIVVSARSFRIHACAESSIALQCGNGLRAIMLYCNKKYQLENVDVRIGENTFSISYKNSHEIVVNMGKPSSLIIDDKKNIQKISTEKLSELNLIVINSHIILGYYSSWRSSINNQFIITPNIWEGHIDSF